MKNKIKLLILYSVMMTPVFVFAKENVGTLVARFTDLINPLIALLTGIALIVFFWGLVKFIYSAGSEQGRTEGRQRMIWGIIALFVLVSIWGLVQFLQISILGGVPGTGFQ